MSNEKAIAENLGYPTGATVEDCDEDVWVKRPDGTWSILDGDGVPGPISHSYTYLHTHFGQLTFLGVSESLAARFANEGRERFIKAASDPLRPMVDVINHVFDTTPKKLHELVEEERYFIQPDTDFERFEEGLRYGCSEHPGTFSGGVRGQGRLDVVDLLKWIDEHEGEFHNADRQ